MIIQEAKEAIKNRTIVQIIDDPEKWGLLTCLSDDESTAYFQPKGCGFTKIGITLDNIELG